MGEVSPVWPGGLCGKGHDLSAPLAWLYRSGGVRECRLCAVARLPRSQRESKKVGAFNAGLGSWKS